MIKRKDNRVKRELMELRVWESKRTVIREKLDDIKGGKVKAMTVNRKNWRDRKGEERPWVPKMIKLTINEAK